MWFLEDMYLGSCELCELNRTRAFGTWLPSDLPSIIILELSLMKMGYFLHIEQVARLSVKFRGSPLQITDEFGTKLDDLKRERPW